MQQASFLLALATMAHTQVLGMLNAALQRAMAHPHFFAAALCPLLAPEWLVVDAHVQATQAASSSVQQLLLLQQQQQEVEMQRLGLYMGVETLFSEGVVSDKSGEVSGA